MPQNRSFTVADLRDAVADLIGKAPEEVPDDVSFVQLGVDSVGMLRLVNRVRRIGVRPPMDQLTGNPTIVNWQRLLQLEVDRHG
ncbi:MAG TPA: phosphopantetheine-binding protein [Actinoplanes sp.]|nr:phosphopantetheine-binding protein [Actinoplanes sp.]